MELQEFNKMCEDIQKEQTELFNKAKEMFNDGICDKTEYVNIGCQFGGNETFFKRRENKTDDLEGCEISFMIDELTRFEEEYDGHVAIGKSDIIQEIGAIDSYIEGMYYVYDYYELKQDMLESVIKNKIKQKTADLLKPESEKYSRTVDCSMLTLFKEGTIDWNALQKITYKDCDL